MTDRSLSRIADYPGCGTHYNVAALAAGLGCSRWCASEHAKAAGIDGELWHTRTPQGEIAPEPELNDDPERAPLPAMHPVTWGAIAGGTLDA